MNRYLYVIVCCLTLFSCNNDDNKIEDERNVFEGCCSDLPVFGENVDMLDQSQGEITDISRIITVNGDDVNDSFGISNIELYDNRTVTIYNNEDIIIYESSNYGENNYFPQIINGNYSEIIPGTYKYKIVIENEETFLKSGTFCLVGIQGQPEGESFTDCAECFDPVLTCP